MTGTPEFSKLKKTEEVSANIIEDHVSWFKIGDLVLAFSVVMLHLCSWRDFYTTVFKTKHKLRIG